MTRTVHHQARATSRVLYADTLYDGTSRKITGIVDGSADASVPRSLAKSITWRTLGSLDTLILGYLFSGSITIAGAIASVEVLTKFALYYLHERGWAHIKWGRQ